MKKISVNSEINVEFTIKLNLTVGEAEALHAIAGYGVKPFLEVFYPKMGKAYLGPHEEEMRNLFKTIVSKLPFEIANIKTSQQEIKVVLSKLK